MDGGAWPSDWLRGVLSLAVLAVVAEQETYGYAIANRLRTAGLGVVKGGTLYPILTRLEHDGLVASQWRDGDAGPGRKFFRITVAGSEWLSGRADMWHGFTEAINSLIPTLEDGRDQLR